MSGRHHPSDTALAAYATGTLDAARRLVVATHLSLCPDCRRGAAAFEAVGGALLDEIAPTALRPGAFGAVLERLGEPVPDLKSGNSEFGGPLSAYGLGPWRWLGRGISFRTVAVPADGSVRAFMLKAAPGTPLPHHKHTGMEWTCVLKGAYRHDLGVYGAGDFDEADETVEHRPFVEAGEECICLVALEGRVLLQGWMGRMLQPLIRF